MVRVDGCYPFCTALEAFWRSRPRPEIALQELRSNVAAAAAESRRIFKRERDMIRWVSGGPRCRGR